MHKVKRIAAFVCIRPVGAAVVDFEVEVWPVWIIPDGREIDAEDFGAGVCVGRADKKNRLRLRLRL